MVVPSSKCPLFMSAPSTSIPCVNSVSDGGGKTDIY